MTMLLVILRLCDSDGNTRPAGLAWNSIVLDVKEKRLNIDGLQEGQAKNELQSAEDVLPRVARECYKWLLCPVQTTPEDRQASIEAFLLNTSGSALGAEIQRVCHDNELVYQRPRG